MKKKAVIWPGVRVGSCAIDERSRARIGRTDPCERGLKEVQRKTDHHGSNAFYVAENRLSRSCRGGRNARLKQELADRH